MITVATLRLLVEHDPETGVFRWRARPRSMAARDRLWMAWNTRYAGTLALNSADANGYRYSRIAQKKIYAHRAALALVTGEWPEEVDHINGDPSDNRITNLRPVTHRENGKNVGSVSV